MKFQSQNRQTLIRIWVESGENESVRSPDLPCSAMDNHFRAPRYRIHTSLQVDSVPLPWVVWFWGCAGLMVEDPCHKTPS